MERRARREDERIGSRAVIGERLVVLVVGLVAACVGTPRGSNHPNASLNTRGRWRAVS
jgi:hypothetical protein